MPVGLKDLELGHPVQLARGLHWVPAQGGNELFPAKQHIGSLFVDTALGSCLCCDCLEVDLLKVQCRDLAAVHQSDQMGQRRVVADCLKLHDWFVDFRDGRQVVFDQ